jgi:hypothetical protein
MEQQGCFLFISLVFIPDKKMSRSEATRIIDHKDGVDDETRGLKDIHHSISLHGEETDHKEGVHLEAEVIKLSISPCNYLARRRTTRKG